MSEQLRITHEEMRSLLGTLATVYPPPREQSLDAIARTWVWALGASVDAGEVKEAIHQYISGEHKHWPRPATIRELAIEYRRSVVSHSGTSDSRCYWQAPRGCACDPCCVCGERLRLLSWRERAESDPVATTIWDPSIPGGPGRDGRRRMGAHRQRREGDPEPRAQYGVLHNALVHRRRGAPIIGYWFMPGSDAVPGSS
jgi:hypothetical protein